MTLSPAFLDELRARTTLSALIGKDVKLTRAGREYKACCPFHDERTPSFYVNDDKGFYHCFGCQAHGDAIRFLTDARGLPFMDAVKELAAAAGMEMPAADPRARERAEQAAGLHEMMAAAARWFQEQLGGLEGAEARAYLKGRGISAASQQKFAIGYAPDSRGKLKDALKSFGKEALVEAGLLIQPEEKGREPYDRFRGRLMIPIRDPRGRVIAFGGRILGSGEPKYLNSPDTPLFDKGRTLYNLDLAGAAARKSGRLIVVEGYMDVIALDQAGIAEAVAPLGTALTEMQMERLWRLDSQPMILFDGDAAGQRAALKAAERSLPRLRPGYTLRFVQLPPGQDPDDLVRQSGAAAITKFLTSPEPLVDRVWRGKVETADLSSPEGRAGLKETLYEVCETIQDQTIRQLYWLNLRERFWENFGWRKKDVKTVAAAQSLSKRMDQKVMAKVHRALLLGLSRYPDILRDNFEAVSKVKLSDHYQETWRDIMSFAVLSEPSLNENLLEQILASSEVSPLEKRDIVTDLAFSFFRARDPERGQVDLKELIGTLVAEQEVAEVYAATTTKLQETLNQSDWEEHLRRREEREQLVSKLGDLMEAFRKGAG